MKIDAKMFLDERSFPLWNEVNSKSNIELKYWWNRYYECQTSSTSCTIFIPNQNHKSASFAHELLHIKLHCDGLLLGTEIRVAFAKYELLDSFMPEEMENICNCIEHILMWNSYKALGYRDEDFLLDFDTAKSDEEKMFLIGCVLSASKKDGLAVYLAEYFKIKGCFSKALKDTNRKLLQTLESIDMDLFILCEVFIQKLDSIYLKKSPTELESAVEYLSSSLWNWAKSDN